ncbi:hypothetical protein ACJZ2D_001789 [Fusarium nematophilum]
MSSQTAAGGESARQSTTPLSIRDIHNVNTTAAPGVALSDHERLLVGSILDLYEGRGTLRHLSLWSQHAYHANPPGIMTGHRRIVAAWYAHAASLESSHIQSHMVQSTSPIRFNLSINETFRGLGLQVMINSEVRVHVDEDGKIKRLEERWDTVTNEGARRAQSIQGQSFLGQAWIRITVEAGHWISGDRMYLGL